LNPIRYYLKIELTGWKPIDLAWLSIATSIIIGLSIFWHDTMFSILAALSGVWCVILTGKGKRSSFIFGFVFGFVNAALYAVVSFQAKYYGEVMLNVLYYMPMSIVGWVVWKRHMNHITGEVVKRRLNFKNSLFLYSTTIALIFIYALVLKILGGNLPIVDSMTTIVSIVAQILSIKRLMEQWVLWIVVDAATIFMWAVHFMQGGESIATLAMWSVYLINALLMYTHWNKEVKENEI